MLRLPTSTIRVLSAAGLLSLLASAACAQGTPRSVGECERLKNDLAYNQCLAMFGPAAKNVAGGDGSGGGGSPVIVPPPTPSAIAGMPALEEPVIDESPRRGRRGRYTRSGGRQSASFDVGGSSHSRRHRRRR